MTKKIPARLSRRVARGGPAGQRPGDEFASRSWLTLKSLIEHGGPRTGNGGQRPAGTRPAGGKGPGKGERPHG